MKLVLVDDSATSSSKETTVDPDEDESVPVEVHIAGLLLNDKHLEHLCLTQYGYTAEDLRKHRPTDLAVRYYAKYEMFDGADLVDISSSDGEIHTEPTYLLPCVMAIVDRGLEPPPLLPLCKHAGAYARRWINFDRLLKDPVFHDVELSQAKWPDNVLPRGLVYHKLRLMDVSYLEKYLKALRECMAKEGITLRTMPTMLPVFLRQKSLKEEHGGAGEDPLRALGIYCSSGS